MENEQNQDTQPTEEKKNSLASRALVAAAFGTVVGTHVNNIGTVMDVRDILKGQNLELRSVLTRKFWWESWEKLKEKHKATMVAENKGWFAAGAKVFKYTIITTVIGGAAGAALGWTLGGRIENWKDIFKHPWQSTKVIFGMEKPKTEQVQTAAASIPETTTPETSTKWQNYAKNRPQNSVVAGKVV